ncbi:MAG TPA: ABC transporter ATP-binding protein [Spirochaetales bacterium]|nr:ABC transporter ATP-binding protein [Spirochaetales bacterium]HRZ66064.1 ABC transporter ATP-binding protein [Spirochaetia bacterium]
MPVVELRKARKEYRLGQTRVEALRGVDLEIERGEFLAVAGPSGSGKSTMLNLVGCIDVPSSGQVLVDGVEVGSLGDRELTRYRREKIGFIFQSFNLIPVLDVYENIEFPLLLKKGFAKKEREALVMRFVEEVGLADRLRNKPGELSGGQRQRVAIARALVSKPLIVLADEPTANLDSETGARIVELMRQINEEEGTTFIFSTHDAHIMGKARRVVRILDGRVEDAGAAPGTGKE